MKITRGKIDSAQKVVIYGPEGIGKSTFAAQFPEPLFIDTEGSTKNMDVARMDKPTSWTMLKNQIAYIRQNPGVCKTLVIDTIDWGEKLCIEDICAVHNKRGIEDFGYGNGYVYEMEEFGRFLNSLEELISAGINVVLTAHAQLRKFTQPDEFGEYDRWELKLGKKTGSMISPMVKEWADMLLFANYKTVAVQADDKGKKFKAQGGERVMYATHHPCWDAKNRHGLPDSMPFDYAQIMHIFTAALSPAERALKKLSVQPTNAEDAFKDMLDETPDVKPAAAVPEGIPAPLADLMRQNKVSEEEIRLAVSQKGYFPFDMPIGNYPEDFIKGVLIGAWEQVYNMIISNRDLPFK